MSVLSNKSKNNDVKVDKDTEEMFRRSIISLKEIQNRKVKPATSNLLFRNGNPIASCAYGMLPSPSTKQNKRYGL